jgi:hypothetical protein
MAPRISVLTLTVVTAFGAAPFAAADDASLGKDLKATIALQGMPAISCSRRNAMATATTRPHARTAIAITSM